MLRKTMGRHLGVLLLLLACVCASSNEKGQKPKAEDSSMKKITDFASATPAPLPKRESVDGKEVVAEAIGVMMLVGMGCGGAISITKEPGSAWVLQVALTFGLAMAALSFAIDFFCHGHMNPAVTIAMLLIGQVSPQQCVANIIGQMGGSFMGAALLHGVYPPEKDKTGCLASNKIEQGFSVQNVIIGEVAMSFMYVFLFIQQGAHPNSDSSSASLSLALGMASFLAHSVLIPLDGCSINPARSFGPAYIASRLREKEEVMKDIWLFMLAPCGGAVLAAASYLALGP
mmetsp:Transcript_32996/g.60668  ORF Transcript_32996/g.60668 Transcript_32996/m.60668 type:complete len:287 (+) Transcript_32996:34-894(+)